MGFQQNFKKHQNFNLPNFFPELLELYGSLQNLPFCQSYDGNSFSIIDHLEAEDHDDQQPEKSSKSAEDFTTNLAVGTEFPTCSDGLQHVLHGVHQMAHLEREEKSSSEGNGVFCHISSKEAPKSTKQRMKWTEDLHDQFVECVNRLGGAKKATPKRILMLMNTNALTIFHVKSHLQKYRTSKHIAEKTKEKSEKYRTTLEGTKLDMESGMKIKEALENVNRILHEQLEIQHNLQILVEEQGKQLKILLLQQQKTNNNLLMKSTQISNSDQMQNDQCNSSNDVDRFSLTEGSGSSHLHSLSS